MYVFFRTGISAPDRILDAAAFAVDIAAKASSISGLEVSAWQLEYGAPVNTFTWTTSVESQAAMGVARDKLMADAGYVEAVMAAADLFEGAAEDVIAEIVATAGNGGHRGDFAYVVLAQCGEGKIAQAMGWGVEILNHVAGVTGRDGLFTRSMYGPWAGVAWINLAASLDEVDAAAAALSADPDYLAKVDGAAGLFLPGSGQSRLSRRIG